VYQNVATTKREVNCTGQINNGDINFWNNKYGFVVANFSV
jgi:hypothetical protein